jgi:hypothetical protein
MRRRGGLLAGIAVLLVASGALYTHRRGLPVRGTLTVFRDPGGCVVGDNPGVELRWDEQGATVEPVLSKLIFAEPIGSPWTAEKVSTGAPRAIPLERAREIARTFDEVLSDTDPPMSLFRQRTMVVTLSTEDNGSMGGSLDCRADLDLALESQATNSGARWDWVRWATHRVGLWTSRGEMADPLLDELFADANG